MTLVPTITLNNAGRDFTTLQLPAGAPTAVVRLLSKAVTA
jgi:hypothetical protein